MRNDSPIHYTWNKARLTLVGELFLRGLVPQGGMGVRVLEGLMTFETMKKEIIQESKFGPNERVFVEKLWCQRDVLSENKDLKCAEAKQD